jgi:WD40 repeat protein
VRSWTIERCQVEADRFVGHRRPVTAFAFTDNGGFLATVSQDGTMRLWDTETDEEVSIRRMARQDAARKTIRYQFHNLAAFTSGASLPEDARRNYLATTGAEPEAGASPAESLTLWDIASRKQADLLKPRSSGRSPEESGRDLLGLARGRWRQSRMLTDQAPRCP